MLSVSENEKLHERVKFLVFGTNQSHFIHIKVVIAGNSNVDISYPRLLYGSDGHKVCDITKG